MESWTQEQENREWDSALNQMDAKIQLDAFQRQHDQIHKSHLDLIGMGRSISSEIDQSDRAMFGPLGRIHPAVEGVESLVVRMVQACQRMEGVARPRLRQLKERHQYHVIKQKWSKVSKNFSKPQKYPLQVIQWNSLSLMENLAPRNNCPRKIFTASRNVIMQAAKKF